MGLAAALVLPSPKIQEWFVNTPVEASVKSTSSGAAPFVGLAVNADTGAGGITLVTVI